ncbi:MAG: FAD-dependent oxidoreductase [Hyphomicrobiales bacterium]|nr:FAD-dependent oxidoreductase [Hyphomicrobiales bacterium]MCP5374268.1 FAD-dependent oxidoreductase [Hyphomicrobiales bacterium]
MAQITVIGAGFAALSAVEHLRKAGHRGEITVIAPRPEFVYLPSLIWLPSEIRKPEDLVIPLQHFFAKHRVTFHAGMATGLADGGRRVLTDTGDVANDGLIIGTGGRFIKKLPGIEHAITPCEGVAAGVAIRDRLKALDGGTIAFGFAGNPNEGTAMRGGPMFEFLFGADRLLRKQGRRDRFRLVFFSPAPKPGIRLGAKVVPKLLARMARHGIDTHLGHKMVRFEADKVVTEGGEFAADLILFMPGMTGNKWFDDTDLPRSPGGLVQADEFCRVVGWDKVYVAGDSGSFPGPDWMPKQAHMADLQAAAAAKNLVADLAGGAADATFRCELVCIIDEGDRGTLVARTPWANVVLPSAGLWHGSKRLFEWWYLRRFK